MKNDFTHENFEDYLKRSANGLRMKPPDRVWQNLSGELSKRRRRFLFGLSSFLLVASTAGYFVIANVNEKPVSLPSADKTSEGQKSSGNQPAINQKPEAAASNVPAVTEQAAQPRNNQTRSDNPLRVAYLATQPNATVAAVPETVAPAGNEDAHPAGDDFAPTVVDSYTEFEQGVAAPAQKGLLTASTDRLPYSVESVLNSFRKKTKRFETQLYFTPTVSYRKLSENKSYLRSVNPTPDNYTSFTSNVNSSVTHKPDVGFELGFAAKYRLSEHLKLRAGVQFNVNRYDVRAFLTQPTQAPIALNTSPRVDSLNTYSRYSNVAGYKSDWLQNLSFQFSAPVGLEYLFSGNGKVRFGLAGTVQPTYVLGDRAYLITTNYKSYTQVPWLVRRWNVNTAFETFVNIEGAKTRWQLGPQVRYQLLSSFISKYPVKENLFDFGLKVGVSLSK